MQHFQSVHRSGGNDCCGSGEGVRDKEGEGGEGDGGGGGGGGGECAFLDLLVGIIGVGVVVIAVDCGLWIVDGGELLFTEGGGREGGGCVSQVDLFFDVDFKMEFEI